MFPSGIERLTHETNARIGAALQKCSAPILPDHEALILQKQVVLTVGIRAPAMIPGANVHANILAIGDCDGKRVGRNGQLLIAGSIYNDLAGERRARVKPAHRAEQRLKLVA